MIWCYWMHKSNWQFHVIMANSKLNRHEIWRAQQTKICGSLSSSWCFDDAFPLSFHVFSILWFRTRWACHLCRHLRIKPCTWIQLRMITKNEISNKCRTINQLTMLAIGIYNEYTDTRLYFCTLYWYQGYKDELIRREIKSDVQ